MMTAFYLSDNTASGVRAVRNWFRRNRIRVEHRYCDTVALKSVTYEWYRGAVNRTSIKRFLGSSCEILCGDGNGLPEGYKRFSSDELSRRLCENAALYLLNSIGTPHIRIVLTDDTGDHIGLCRYLADHTDSLSVITEKTKLFLDEADRLIEEKGAVIRISRGDAPLKNADLIIAPAPLKRTLPCDANAVILSSAAPLAAQNAPVIRDYAIELPEKYRALCPSYLESGYFASALYTLAGAHELGSSSFRRCTDGYSVHTRMSLTELLRRRLAAV